MDGRKRIFVNIKMFALTNHLYINLGTIKDKRFAKKVGVLGLK
jgi:hypothetical protein